jgi:hypothetical protein
MVLADVRLRKVPSPLGVLEEIQLNFSLTLGLKHPIRSIP